MRSAVCALRLRMQVDLSFVCIYPCWLRQTPKAEVTQVQSKQQHTFVDLGVSSSPLAKEKPDIAALSIMSRSSHTFCHLVRVLHARSASMHPLFHPLCSFASSKCYDTGLLKHIPASAPAHLPLRPTHIPPRQLHRNRRQDRRKSPPILLPLI